VDSLIAFGSSLAAAAPPIGPLRDPVMDPTNRKKGQEYLVGGMVACAASVALRRFDLDFLSGVCLGISLSLFFLGFRAFHRP